MIKGNKIEAIARARFFITPPKRNINLQVFSKPDSDIFYNSYFPQKSKNFKKGQNSAVFIERR